MTALFDQLRDVPARLRHLPAAALGVLAVVAYVVVAVIAGATMLSHDPPLALLVGGGLAIGATAAIPGRAGDVLQAVRRVAVVVAAFATIYLGVYMAWAPTTGVVFIGASIGLLYGLLGVGIVLLYRSNRIINFAAGSLGTVPAVFFGLLLTKGFSYWLAFPLTLLGGAAMGAGSQKLVIRRFSSSPRLILTVVTIGLAQLCTFMALQFPSLLDIEGLPDQIRTPFTRFKLDVGGSAITGDYFVAAVVTTVLVLALIAFFRYSRMGIAVRASAENADRALMLGIPVGRVETIAWSIAGLFAAATIFLRSPLVGLPIGGLASYNVILYALAAATIARMDRIGTALFAGVGIGILDQSSVFGTGRGSLSATLMLPVILVALMLQRGTLSRAFDTGVSSFKSLREVRPVPPELRHLPELRQAKGLLFLAVAAFFLSAPAWMGSSLGRGTLVVIFAIVGVSLVVLTGWAGQISLGQFAFVGIGATVGGGLAANHNIDIFAALLIGGLAGALSAVIVGIPALRVQGLFLAVTTLALSVATEFFLLTEDSFFGKWFLPESGRSIRPPLLWQRFNLDPFNNTRSYYYFCVAVLFLMVLAATAFRRNRSGRVVIAGRDNERAAASYGINIANTKLAAFAVSGYIAATAGVLFAYQDGSITAGSYGANFSVQAFIVTVIGGIGSIPGAVMGAIVIQGVDFAASKFDLTALDLLVTAPGLILVLYFLPGGFAQLFYDRRDAYLRKLAVKHQIHVPSLLADSLVADEAKAEEEILMGSAAASAATTTLADVATRHGEHAIACPACGVTLSVEEALDHEHLRVPSDPTLVMGGSA
jgi:branched-chain amino acid transport system permease protein